MPYANHEEAYEDFRQQVLDGLKAHFPVKGRRNSLELENIEVDDKKTSGDDLQAQYDAKMRKMTWASPVYGNFVLRGPDGEEISKERMKIAEIPRITSRYSYIVSGQEYQVDNQWLLRPGAYTRRKEKGDLETHFNIRNNPEFRLTLDPGKQVYYINRGKSEKIPALPVMRALGVTDKELRAAWGDSIFQANDTLASGPKGDAIDQIFKVDRKREPKTATEAMEHVKQVFADSRLDPRSTKLTLGQEFTAVTGPALKLASKRLIDVMNGSQEDDRDSLVFKELRTVADFAKDQLNNRLFKRVTAAKMGRKIDQTTSIRDVVATRNFTQPLNLLFIKNAAARTPDQNNPVEMFSQALQTTIMGPGGLQSDDSIQEEMKLINPSHLGYLDPLRTPEGERTGVTLRLPIGTRKIDGEAAIPLYNMKTRKTDYVKAGDFYQSNVAMADQVTWKDGHPVPKHEMLDVAVKGSNDIQQMKPKDVDYVMLRPSQLFNLTTNLIPFLGNTSGNRATYAGAHMEQSVSLKNRDVPLVQVGTGADAKYPGVQTFEQLVGRNAAHLSNVDGEVLEVHPNRIVIRTPDGKKATQHIYNNFPLNNATAVMTSDVKVKVGQRVKKDDVLADTNFTRDGKLALGTNVRVAYLPYKGYNFEDGIVISESAAREKFASIHLHKPTVKFSPDIRRDLKFFQHKHAGVYSKDQFAKMDDQGVVRVGQRVMPGDPLVLGTRPFNMRDRTDASAVRKKLAGAHADVSLTWQGQHAGEVTDVYEQNGEVRVHVKTLEPIEEGDKLSARYGNKGIISKVLPDKDMPHTKDGKPLEVILNPSGVPGRMNAGQIFETVAAKIALKTGKPYIVHNFDGQDTIKKIQDDLKANGLTDTEEVIDPLTGQSLGQVLCGTQHMFKLVHQVAKKFSARGGMPLPGELSGEAYDQNLIPVSGSKVGASTLGNLGMNALLAHGAYANIREIQTYKSEGEDPDTNPTRRHQGVHRAVWTAIQAGLPLPAPRVTFAFKKFEAMLRAAGVNVEKKGHELMVTPRTDADVLRLSSGELKDPTSLTAAKLDPETGEPKPIKGGLFDEVMTGGHGGKKWTHFKLAEPLPNPLYRDAITKMLGMKLSDYDNLVMGQKAIKDGKLVALGTAGAMTGGHAVKSLLEQIDPKKALEETKKQLGALKLTDSIAFKDTADLNRLVQKARYLRALNEADLKPVEAYVIHYLPVIPPAMRPASVLPSGGIKWADVNDLYSKFAMLNEKLADPVLSENLTDKAKAKLRFDYADGLAALIGFGTKGEYTSKGFLDQISGSAPKYGFFQKTLLARRQDLSLRSVITPEPSLGIDEVGLPKKLALKAFRPFVVNKLVRMSLAKDELEAQKMLAAEHPYVWRALEAAMVDRPVMLKRDPALHKYSVQAFMPRLVAGQSMKIHPLVTGGFNADFDGDTMSAYVPISQEAVDEAKRMMPSQNLFNDATGRVMFTPSLESATGLFKLSRVGKTTSHRYANNAEALKALNDGKVSMDDVVQVGKYRTTAGRVLLSLNVPPAMREKVLSDLQFKMDKQGMEGIYTDIARKHKGEFGVWADRLKNLGNGASYGTIRISDFKGADAVLNADNKIGQYIKVPTQTLTLKDLEPDRVTRDRVMAIADKDVAEIKKKLGAGQEQDRQVGARYRDAGQEMLAAHKLVAKDRPTEMFTMLSAGQKPGNNQYQQMVLAPVAVKDAQGRILPRAIRESYSEGLGLSSYWTQTHGARSGSVQKVQEVRDPGYFTKQLMNTTMGIKVTATDCGTATGLAFKVKDDDIMDRRLAQEVRTKSQVFAQNTVITPQIAQALRTANVEQVLVRSPMKCEHHSGVCQHCAGMSPDGQNYDLGTNVGVLAAHSIGERATQLTLKAFHSGGVATAGAAVTNAFKRTQELTLLPRDIKNAATVSMEDGDIEKIESTPTGVNVVVNGKKHFVGKDTAGQALHVSLPGLDWAGIKVGQTVKAGQSLTDPYRTSINPHDLYKATKKIDTVQRFIADELYNTYKTEGVRRQNIETLVRAMGDLTKVRDPGSSPNFLPGEFTSRTALQSYNKKLVAQGFKPVQHTPILKGINVLPHEVQEDWMARMNVDRLATVVSEAASTRARSNIHGVHPIAGMAYGAEFGLNKKHSLRHGYQHLQDVPEVNY